ncbi:MAG: hypothetical protein LBF68_02780 [Christensenellaceae bacterium]|jgi:hypothetical protein|nr:hypothetical protein [Christensenellaceae bacterium]
MSIKCAHQCELSIISYSYMKSRELRLTNYKMTTDIDIVAQHVMYTYTNSVIALSENDIASFDEAFKRY